MSIYEEFEEYQFPTQEQIMKNIDKQIRSLKANKKRLQRNDIGKKRETYNSELPIKYKSYLMRANKKGFPFEFTVEEFEAICSADCFYCGDSGFGIDRVNSKLGYTKENSVPCCSKCNMMKYTMSQMEFFKMCEKIYKHMMNK